MTDRLPTKYQDVLSRCLRNRHVWVVLATSAILILVYQAWPWREWQFTQGVWRYFSWLSKLDLLVTGVELRYEVMGALFLIPIIYGSVTMSWPGGVFAWLLSLIWVLPTLIHWSRGTLLVNMLLLLLPVLLVAVVALERRWREIERRHFVEREKERQAYIAKLVEAEENERRRIAQEIHDDTLQTLMVVANRADSLASSSDDESQIRGNLWIKSEVVQTMEDLRRLSMNLRPSILDNFGLVSGVRWLVNNNNAQDGCRIEVTIVGEERPMSSLAQVTVFRVVQEAIHNIQRHAQAAKGTVVVELTDDRVKLEIVDDGVGFQPPERLTALVNEGKLGMIGMEQRVLSAGGVLTVGSEPGKGTRLVAEVPYEAPSQQAAGAGGTAGNVAARLAQAAGNASAAGDAVAADDLAAAGDAVAADDAGAGASSTSQSRSSRVRIPDFRQTKIASVLERTFSFWNTPTK